MSERLSEPGIAREPSSVRDRTPDVADPGPGSESYPPLNKQCARVVYRDFNNWLPCNRQSGHRGDCEAA